MSVCPTCGKAHKKTDAQRNLFHKMCRVIGLHLGLTAGKVKEAIKIDFFGIDEWKVGDKWYRSVKPSESADRGEYSELIDYVPVWCSENDIDVELP